MGQINVGAGIVNWQEFWAMGGYALYVWSAWGITLITMVWLMVSTLYKKKALTESLKRKIRREQQLQQTSNAL